MGDVHSDGTDASRIIEHINKHEGVEWVTFEQMCDEFKSKNKPAADAMLPKPREEVLERLGLKQTATASGT